MRNKLLATIGLSVVLSAVASVQAGVLHTDLGDGMLEDRNGTSWVDGPAVHNTNDWQYNVGEWYNNGDPVVGNGLTTVVMPFQLPNLGAEVNPFTAADFGVMVHTIGGATVTDVDLYAVRTDASPAILASDWYNGAAPDPSATLIQESFLTPASSAGFVGAPNNFTDAAGDAALVDALNAAYNGGSGAGEFLFLRLSYGSDDFASGWDAYTMTTADAGQEGEWPVITYEAIPEPATMGLLGLAGLTLWFGRRLRF